MWMPARRLLVLTTMTFLATMASVLSCSGRRSTGPSPVASVSVAHPGASFVQVGSSLRLAATPLDVAGFPVVGQTATWSSSDPTIAAVTAGGLVTAVAPGAAPASASSAAATIRRFIRSRKNGRIVGAAPPTDYCTVTYPVM